MDDAEQSRGRGSTAEESAGTSSTEVVESRPSHVPGRSEPAAEDGAGEPEARFRSAPEVEATTVERASETETETETGPETDPESGPEPVVGSDSEPEAQVETEAEADGKARRRRMPAWLELPLLVVIAMTLVLSLNTFVAQPFVIPSGSMENTLQVNDRVLVNKLAYRFGDIERGDLIVFDGKGSFTPEGGSEPNPVVGAFQKVGAMFGFTNPDDDDFVKRVIGIGGDRVKCCDAQGRVTVNGVPLDESDYLYPGDKPSEYPFEVVVPKGALWVMGDHRSNSADSRAHLGSPGGGFVREHRVIGRAQWIIWPFDRLQGADRPKTFDRSDFDRRG